jgi:pimeloyl-ACP methyl ester carboxylesterase
LSLIRCHIAQVLCQILQLSQLTDTPVWVCYGTADPWTPAGSVEALKNKPIVEKVVALEGIGHCPHDKAPDLVETLLLEFLNQIEMKILT